MSSATISPAFQLKQFTDLPDIDLLSINNIRTHSMDGVQAANSGHPGTPMALAPVAYCLWQQFLRFDPADPVWPNRDRFVLSIGVCSRGSSGRQPRGDPHRHGQRSRPMPGGL